ncbi:MAG: ComF family protein [Ruminococcus sp.]|nr:ComF family protein [Ruminococcus sp.]
MKMTQKLCRFCIDIIYPNRCPCCGEFIVWNELICSECAGKVRIDTDSLCRKCGKAKEDCICTGKLMYDEAAAISYYEDEAKTGLIAMKNSVSRNFGWYAGIEIGSWIMTQPEWMKCDGIVPVPMSRSKKMLRGYNQADIIAKGICDVTGIPLMKDCIIKKHSRQEQHTLGAKERAENVYSFIPAGRDLDGKRLIICDDIITTGSTINRCAEILKDCGAEKVYAAAAAVTVRKREEQDGSN